MQTNKNPPEPVEKTSPRGILEIVISAALTLILFLYIFNGLLTYLFLNHSGMD